MLYIFGYKINIVHNAPEQQSSARARLYYAETGFAFPFAALFSWYLFRLRSFHGFCDVEYFSISAGQEMEVSPFVIDASYFRDLPFHHDTATRPSPNQFRYSIKS